MSVSKEVFIMAKTIFEQMGGTYTIQGDYYLPDPQTVSKAAP